MGIGDWQDAENDAIVADYFAILAKELAGQPYGKAEHNGALQRVIGRGRGSIEFKHQNISAILMEQGETWILGYKPASNYQQSLERAVLRWLDTHPEWLHRVGAWQESRGFAEGQMLYIGPPPTHSNAPPPVELEKVMAKARKFDVAGRDARNRALGRAGEELVLHHERKVLIASGRGELARKVRWTSEEEGDGAGYDIASFTPAGKPRLIEVKTTNGWERTPFHISANELAVADERRSEWCLLRLWNFSRGPSAFELYPPLDAHVALAPTSFLAAFH